MAAENSEKTSEEKSINPSESKSAEKCTRECLQFEWLDNMSNKLPGAGKGTSKPEGLSDLTITQDGGRPGADAATPDAGSPGTKLDAASPGTKSDAGSPGTKPDAASPGTKSDAGSPGTKPDAGSPSTKSDAESPGTKSDAVSPHSTDPHVTDRTAHERRHAEEGADPASANKLGEAAASAGLDSAANRLGDKAGAGTDATPAAKDLRKEIIHLAEYGHCTFADRNEYRDTLDKVLKEFSDKPEVSERNKILQSMIADFLKNPNQESYAAFSKQFNAFFMESGRLARETVKELDAETAKNMTPERRAAEADMLQKHKDFFKDLDKLPKEEKDRIMCLMDWQDEGSKEQRDERTRAGLAGHPKLLAAYNAMVASSDKRDAMRSPREAQLAEQHRQEVRDNILARAITTLMLHRSRIA